MGIRIVTDSSAVIPTEWVAARPIEVVPLTISWDGEEHTDGEITYAEFARRIEAGASVPKTSAPSPGAFQQAFERLLAETDGLLVLTPPEELSATYQNAELAARTVDPERIRVLDSRAAAAAQGLVALEAACAADGDLETCARRARAVAEGVQLWATVERLDYLRRSGRVPAVASFATGALDIHALFRFVEGEPHGAGAARGAQRAADRVFRAWRESIPPEPAHGRVIVFHSSRAEEADQMRQRIAAQAADLDTALVEITASMAAHIGPGLLGVAWWWDTNA